MYYFFYLFHTHLCFMGIIYYIRFALSSNVICNYVFYIIYIILWCDCAQFQSFSKLIFLVFLYCFPLYLIFWIGIFRLFSMCKNSRHDVQIQTAAMKNRFIPTEYPHLYIPCRWFSIAAVSFILYILFNELNLFRGKRKKPWNSRLLYFLRKMGLEPTRYCYHKILSLARLPIPTLPHSG